MTYSEPARPTTPRIPRIHRAALLVVIAAIIGVLGYQSLASSSAMVAAPTDVPPNAHRLAPPSSPAAAPTDVVGDEQGGALGEADGAVPRGATVFDEEVPGVAKLDAALLDALRRAATDAARDDVSFYVDSGWRSAAYQEQLLREAISKYGSAKEAARWVATPNTSPHVSGDAVDIGHADATAWLSRHGARYGLCQIYGNEPWHFELRADAVGRGCPPMYADPTQDPRMRP